MKKIVISLSLFLIFCNFAFADESKRMLPYFGRDSEKSSEELKNLPIEAYSRDVDGYISPKISKQGEAICPSGYSCTTINYIVRCVENTPTDQKSSATNQNKNDTGKTLLNTAGAVGVGILRGILSK